MTNMPASKQTLTTLVDGTETILYPFTKVDCVLKDDGKPITSDIEIMKSEIEALKKAVKALGGNIE